jgi:putative SOS response-associated peptidase YedK
VGKSKDSQSREGAADITVMAIDPNEVVQPTHDRMPVIIPERDDETLVEADSDGLPIDLLRPFDADKMTAWKVDKAGGNPEGP